MKIQVDKRYFKASLYFIFTIATLIVFYKVIDNFSNAFDSFRIIIDFVFALLRPVIIAAIIAYFIYRPVKWMEINIFDSKYISIKRKKLRRIISILTIYIIIFILLASFLSFTLPRMGRNISDLIAGVPDYVEKTGEIFTELDINKRIQDFIEGLPIESQAIENYDLFKDVNKYINEIFENAQSTIEGIVSYAINSAVMFTSGLLDVVLAIFITFYILQDKEDLFRGINKFSDAFFSTTRVKRWRETLYLTDEIFGKYLMGNIIDSTIIGAICFVGMVILDIRYALLISIIIGITNLIPFFGPFIGAVPSIILTLFDSPIKALWVAIFILVLQQFDGNYLKPKVLGDKVGLNPFWVLFSIIVGGGLFGVWGMFLGVPTVAVIRVILLQAIEKKNHSTI